MMLLTVRPTELNAWHLFQVTYEKPEKAKGFENISQSKRAMQLENIPRNIVKCYY